MKQEILRQNLTSVEMFSPEARDLETLLVLARHLAPIDVQQCAVDPGIKVSIHTYVKENTIAQTLQRQLQEALSTHGAIVVRLDALSSLEKETQDKALISLLSLVGEPFGPYKKRGLFQRLGVNLNAAPLRAESTGYIPFHIDGDQATDPPDLIALWCIRPDAKGGGKNLVVNWRRVWNQLPPSYQDQLNQISFSYDTLYDTFGIGELYNPHPLVDKRHRSGFLLRFNAKAKPSLEEPTAVIFDELDAIFRKQSLGVSLAAGDLIMIDQRTCLHAREPLNAPTLYTDRPQRLLTQVYIRAPKGP